MVANRKAWPYSLVLVAVWGMAACGTDATKVAGTGTDAAADTSADADAAASKPDATVDAATTPPSATCAGTALQSQFAAFDQECSFLAKCAGAGKCYCGNGCTASKTPKCNPELCVGQDTTCFCGEQCGADKKKCTQFVCQPLDIKGCEPQEDCLYIGTPPPKTCECTKMPNAEPDCWCGKCTGGQPACEASKCKGKNPDKCIVVPGAAKTGLYCDACGLLGTTPKCFFITSN